MEKRRPPVRVLPFLLIFPALFLVGWTVLGTNIFGIPYGTSTYVNPTDGYAIQYQASTKTYELKLGGGSPTNVPWGGTAAAGSAGLQHLGIPLYIYPDANWTTVDNTAAKTSIIIADDSSGNPPVQDPNYLAAINTAKAKGLTVLMYVPVNYAADSIATVEAKIDKNYTFYAPDGIFFDQAPSAAGSVAYITTLYNYVRAKTGADLVALNPGTTCDEGYAAVSDIIVTFEGTYASYTSYVPDTWTRKYNSIKFWHLVYSTPLANLANAVTLTKANGAGWVDITDVAGYTALSSYFAASARQVGYAAGDDVRLPPPPLTAGRIPYDTTTGVTWTATGGTSTQVIHGGATPSYSKVVVADIDSGAANINYVPLSDGAGGVLWGAQTGGGGSSPTGAAGGDLTGSTYPNPVIAALAVTDAKVAAANKDGLAAVASMRTLGTGSTQATAGNDSRLSDARTPTAHAASHLPGGSDALTTATAVSVGAANGAGSAASFARSDHTHTIGAGIVTDTMVAAANKDGAAGTASMRTIGTGAAQSCGGADSRLSDARTPTAHATSHKNGGSDEVATATAAANAIPKAGAGGTLAAAWMQEVLNLADLLDVSGKTGTGSTVVMDTAPTINGLTIPAANVLTVTQSTAIPAGYSVGLCADAAAGNTVNVSWTAVSVSDGTQGVVLGTQASMSASCATPGPAINGRDQAGAFANNVWVYVYAISKADGTVPALLLSQSATAPTLPATYTKKSNPLTAFFTAAGVNISKGFSWLDGRAYYYSSVNILSGGTATSLTSLNTGSSTGMATAVPPQANTFTATNVVSGTVAGGTLLYSYDGTSTFTIGILQVSGVNYIPGFQVLPCSGQIAYYKMSTASDSGIINCAGWGWSIK